MSSLSKRALIGAIERSDPGLRDIWDRYRGTLGIWGGRWKIVEGEPALVCDGIEFVGVEALTDLDQAYRSKSIRGTGTPLKDFLDSSARAKKNPTQSMRPLDYDKMPICETGNAVWLRATGDKAMTNVTRYADANIVCAVNPNSYTGAYRSPEGLVFLEQVSPPKLLKPRPAPAKTPVGIGLFPRTLGEAGFAPDPVADEIHRCSAFRSMRGHPDEAVMSVSSELCRLVSLSHSLRCWVPWGEDVAAEFHYGLTDGQPRRNEAKGKLAHQIFIAAGAMRLHVRGDSFGLIGSFEHPKRGWLLGPPRYIINAAIGREKKLQPRFSGAIGRIPRRGHQDQTGFLFHIAEGVLHSGQLVKGVPELIASNAGVTLASADLYELCGLALPIDPNERKRRVEWWDRRIDSIIEAQEKIDKPDTVRFERLASLRGRPRPVKITATEEYRAIYSRTKKTKMVVGLQDVLPIEVSDAMG